MELGAEKIRELFGGRLVGSDKMKHLVVDVVSRMPHEIARYVAVHCWFLSSSEDAWAYTFNGRDVIDKHFIFLSDELLGQSKTQIEFTVAHEIGHVILKHRNSIGYRQTKRELHKQESEADAFAEQFVS